MPVLAVSSLDVEVARIVYALLATVADVFTAV